MKLVFAPRAEEQADACDSWWRENRPRSRDLFARELAGARSLLLRAPEVGALHGVIDGQPVRRILLEKTRTHVYYAVDAAAGVVTILAVWGAPKGDGPRL
jgi:plasmid stabilization system protein ParE